ncbi:MAG TPA: DUF3352 domain-containing protein [Pyrinomonadaceae bacterium]|jgi:hypothetical protein|nr:DUF3352 domain-containing protein [Pyrinomonadaceae bacterium]
MKPRKTSPRLTPLLLAALLLSFAHAPAAQRRRRSTPPRPAANAPQTQTQTAPTPTPQAQPTPTSQPQPTNAPTPARADAQAQPARNAEPERSIEEMFSADGYGAYAEVRNVGTLVRAEELKSAVGTLGLVGGEETKPLTDLFNFASENAEALAEARAFVAALPTRAGLPLAIVALELPSAESAAAFEPKFRRVVGEQAEVFGNMMGTRPEPAPAGQKPTARDASGQGADAQGYFVKRAGRLLLAAESPFTLKKLRGEEGTSTLAESVRFQSARSRLGSDSIFVYVDTTLAQQGYAVEQQKEQEARAARDRQPSEQAMVVARTVEIPPDAKLTSSAPPTSNATQAATPATTSTPATSAPATGVQATTPAMPAPSPSASPQGETSAPPVPTPEHPTEESAAREATTSVVAPVVVEAREVARADASTATKPSEEQLAVRHMEGVLRNLFEGAPRIPGAVALGVSLDGGALKVRLGVENTPDGIVSIIPFLPNVISGPPVTAAAAEVAPADADIFVTTSLDWTQIYTATLGTASLNPEYTRAMWEDAEGADTAGAKAGAKEPTADETVAAVEKLFGFKFKEDLLPALGNEVAISAPFDSVFGSYKVKRPGEKEEEKDSEPGIIFIVSLNNPDKIRELLPRVFTALNFVSTGAAFAPPEKREGFEIRAAGGVAYAVMDNFLVVSENARVVRHCIDAYAARRTLAAADSYRNSTQWQAQQKLAQAYVSEALMRNAVESTKKISGGSADPIVRGLLAQLDVPPEAASYEVTNEGDMLVHELRVPLSLIKVYALSALISVKDAPVIRGETSTVYTLNRIVYAEHEFKAERKKGRYASLEELVAEGLLEKNFADRQGYKVLLDAAGDKFEATATPKSYGKTGRRSFFVDETGAVRGADHGGQPATADDPPVD